MTSLRVRLDGPLRGTVALPGDLQIGQEALVWAALANGESAISGLADRADHELLCDALRAMGVPIAWTPSHAPSRSRSRAATVRVQGVGLRGLRMPKGALQAGTSPSTLELLTALLCPQRFGTRVEASGAAASHSLRTLIGPLRERGAHVAGRASEDGEVRAPVAVAPQIEGEALLGVEIEIPDGDAATKRGLLLSGLYAAGATVISEGMLSRDHTERALTALGAGIETMGPMTLLDPGESTASWPGFSWDIPGDFSLACFWIAAALARPGSDLRLENVSINRSRTGFLDVLRHAGADVQVIPKGDLAGDEPVGEIRVRSSRLRSVRLAGELAQRVADDALALGALAPSLAGRLSARDFASLRARQPDPVRVMASTLRQAGFECTDYADGFDMDPVPGALPQDPVVVAGTADSALLSCMLGLATGREVQFPGSDGLDALYPGLEETLASLGASIVREEHP